jgi:hypothetical protein
MVIWTMQIPEPSLLEDACFYLYTFSLPINRPFLLSRFG